MTTLINVAIVGAGPSGFYAAEALLKAGACVALLDRLPAPFGLVRYGVAPDHPKLKQTTLTFAKITAHPNFHFFGGVTVGEDISVPELQASFNAVVFAHGASTDRRLGISGEDLPGSHAATEFVAWYNGHPAYRDHEFDLSEQTAVVIGNGNVALDVARILAKPVDALRHTDIAHHALQQLAESQVRHITIVGRRGPEHAKFSHKELAELGAIEQCDLQCSSTAFDHADADAASWGVDAKRNVPFLRAMSAPAVAPDADTSRRCTLEFFKSPIAIHGSRRVEYIELADALDTSISRISCGLVFRAVGYQGVRLAGLPFDHQRGIVPTLDGRVTAATGLDVSGLYATGWIKRGASGIIGTNRADSVTVVETLLRDVARTVGRDGVEHLRRRLSQRGHRAVSFADWERIDRAEIAAGSARGKPREKFTRVDDMMAIVHAVEGIPDVLSQPANLS